MKKNKTKKNIEYGLFSKETSSKIFKEASDYYFYYIKSLCANKNVAYIKELEYIDKGFIIDYKNYYARCFEKTNKTTSRYHFFSISESSLRKYHKEVLNHGANSKKAVESLQKNYLGTVVIRPTDALVVGKSFLRPVTPSKIKVAHSTQVNISGEPFIIKSLPFQAQDKAVSACATVSLWITLHALDHKFKTMHTPAPSEITNLANNFEESVTSSFPNDGLNLSQIYNTLKKSGYNLCCIEEIKAVSRIAEDHFKGTEFVKDYFKTYLNFGVPVIAILKFTKKNEADELHSIVVNGYDDDENIRSNHLKLFAHDDGIGPFVEIGMDISKNSLTYSAINGKKMYNDYKISLEAIITPLYEKIRLRFPYMYTSVLKNEQLTPQSNAERNVSLKLYEINSYREDLRKERVKTDFKKNELADLMGNVHFPKYIWVIRCGVCLNDKEVVYGDRVYDATNHIAKLLYSAGDLKIMPVHESKN
jgi:hypothetical protein